MSQPKTYTNKLAKSLKKYWRSSLWHRIKIVVSLFIFLIFLIVYGMGEWYIHSQNGKPLQYGVSFIPDYAQSLGVDPQQNMDALLKIGVKQFRLVSYWSDGEPAPRQYDFSQLDWEFQKAEAAHAKIVLTVGLRQPRWPECHAPTWVDTSKPTNQWQPQLENYMQKVVQRYKNSPALQDWQVENEYFLKGFGYCNNFSRSRLVSEYNLVKKLDPNHKIIVARSNNALGFPVGQPQPDEFSISIYKRVWDANFSHRYLEYPQPNWFYGFLAEWQRLFLHKDMVIGELQAEAWPPNGQSIQQASLNEQNKSLDAKRLKSRFEFGRSTGMKQIDLWGAEYWYYRLTVLHDPSLWRAAQQEFRRG